MLNSFEQVVRFTIANGIVGDFKTRLNAISAETSSQRWQNKQEFVAILDKIED